MRIYVAGPYSTGDVALNVRRAIMVADFLLKQGHVPFLPHLTHFWHLVSPGPYEQWLCLDLAWLPLCEALVRLPGYSNGADREVTEALRLGVPVYLGIEAFQRREESKP